MSKMSKIKIGSLGNTVTGKTPSSNFPNDFGTEYMFVTPSDSFDQKYIVSTERYLSNEGASKLSKKLLPPNSIMVTCIGSAMGKVAMNKTSCVTNQQINSIILSGEHHPDYIYYCLRNSYQILRNAATGSTALPLLNKTDFDALELPIERDKKAQMAIAGVLSPIDSKIALNNRINAELEAMAKTIYDYWFVQFDFPISAAQATAMGKPELEGKPYKASGGKMVWREELKREVPEGWEVKKFSDWIEADKNGDWGKDTNVGNYSLRVNCVRGTDINGLNGLEQCDPPLRYILEKNSNKILNPFDLIIEISGGSPKQSTGRLAFITEETLSRFDNPLICSNFCKAITLKNPNYIYNFVYHWQLLYRNGVFFGYEGKTSGIKNLLFESFVESHWTAFPDKDVVKVFNKTMHGIQAKKQAGLKENQKLTELRDWLLPMLMNGQIKIRDAEGEVAMAAEPDLNYDKAKQ